MRLSETCHECLLSRVRYECELVCDDPGRIEAATKACDSLLNSLIGENLPSPVIASRVHRCAYRMIGSKDPYHELKAANNYVAGQVAAEVMGQFSTFRELALASIIANTLDYGSREHQVTEDFSGFFSKEFEKGLTIDDTAEIERRCGNVVYLCDNCGEIVFDREVLRYLKKQGSHVTVGVRGGAILNDATLADARLLGLDTIADCLTTTSDGIAELGMNLECIPDDLRAALDSCTLIIAKGMANYESLTEYPDLGPIAYLMSVKCDPIARDVGVPKGSRIAMLVE